MTSLSARKASESSTAAATTAAAASTNNKNNLANITNTTASNNPVPGVVRKIAWGKVPAAPLQPTRQVVTSSASSISIDEPTSHKVSLPKKEEPTYSSNLGTSSEENDLNDDNDNDDEEEEEEEESDGDYSDFSENETLENRANATAVNENDEFPSLASALSANENHSFQQKNIQQMNLAQPKVLNFAQVVAQSQKPASGKKRTATKKAAASKSYTATNPLLLLHTTTTTASNSTASLLAIKTAESNRTAGSLIKNASLSNLERLGEVWPAKLTSQFMISEHARHTPSPLITVPPVDCLLSTSSLSPFLSDQSHHQLLLQSNANDLAARELPSPIGTGSGGAFSSGSNSSSSSSDSAAALAGNKPIGFERPQEKASLGVESNSSSSSSSSGLFADEFGEMMLMGSLVGGLLMSTSSHMLEGHRPDGFVEQPVAPIVSSSSCKLFALLHNQVVIER